MRARIAARVTIVLGMAAAPQVQAFEDPFNIYTRLFCEWTAENKAEPAQPPPYCGALPEIPTPVQYMSEQREWFAAIETRDQALGHELRAKWEARLVARQGELDAERREANLRVEAKRAAEARAQAKARRQAVVASIPKMTTEQLCAEHRRFKTPAAHQQLVVRNSFSPADLPRIAAGRVELGMSEDAMLCVLGAPSSVNKSVGSWGDHRQYVYRDLGLYVYVENGKVASWQE